MPGHQWVLRPLSTGGLALPQSAGVSPPDLLSHVAPQTPSYFLGSPTLNSKKKEICELMKKEIEMWLLRDWMQAASRERQYNRMEKVA